MNIMKIGLNLSLHKGKIISSESFLLDSFPGAAAAYSLRYLSSTYTGDVVLVRRSSDNSELGFTPNEINDGTLTAWVGGGNDGFIKTWYDQSGNSNNVTQTTSSSQPKIISSGSLVTQNSKPALQFNGVLGGTHFLISTPITATNSDSVIMVQKHAGPARTWNAVLADQSSFHPFAISEYNGGYRAILPTIGDVTWGVTASTNQILLSSYSNGSSIDGYENGVLLGSKSQSAFTPTGANYGQIGARNSDHRDGIQGTVQELIIYQSDQSGNRTAIETEINSYYSIY